MRRSEIIRVALLLACLGAGAARADAVLLDKTQLRFALKSGLPCCVIDGRDAAARQQQPLEEALAYVKDMKINPSASSAAVIVADTDAMALTIASALAANHPGKKMIAVKGGLGVWNAALASAAGKRPNASFSPGFVIPKNTCESGTAIQHLRSD